MNTHEQNWDVISRYTREQAIDDGELIDVSPWAKEVGFTAPTVLTRALWAQVDIDSRPAGRRGVQSTRRRAQDVLFMSTRAFRRARRTDNDLDVSVTLKLGRRLVTLRAVIDGDGVTIGFPEDF